LNAFSRLGIEQDEAQTDMVVLGPNDFPENFHGSVVHHLEMDFQDRVTVELSVVFQLQPILADVMGPALVEFVLNLKDISGLGRDNRGNQNRFLELKTIELTLFLEFIHEPSVSNEMGPRFNPLKTETTVSNFNVAFGH